MCGEALARLGLMKRSVARCAPCGAMWYASGVFISLAEAIGSHARPPAGDWQSEKIVRPYSVLDSPPLDCPACGLLMEKAAFCGEAALLVDTCGGCGGIWAADRQLREAAVFLRHNPQPEPVERLPFEETGGLGEGERKVAFLVSLFNPLSLTWKLPYKTDIPVERRPIALCLIAAICIAAFLMQLRGPREAFYFLRFFALTPSIVLSGANYHSYITHMFLHGGILHLLGNLYFLWVFGRNVENALGHRDFVILYFVTGLCAALVQVLLSRESGVPMLGASGAISGMLGCYLYLYPDSNVTIWLRGKHIRKFSARFYLGAWFGVQGIWYLHQLLTGRSTGVAFAAHLGGFAVGWWLAPQDLAVPRSTAAAGR